MYRDKDRLNQSVQAVAHTDFTILRKNLTVQEALADIRRRGMGEKIVYFYVVDTDDRLVGVVPTRRLLTAPLEQRLADIMVARVLTIPADATVMDACEWFILYKYLAFPVVDRERRIVGVVDVSLLTDEVFDVAERARMDEVFEAIGFRVAQVRDASPFKAFRFPWLVSTLL
ncbi:MAG: CBS domain-containing protein [Planctomycetota bacterium]